MSKNIRWLQYSIGLILLITSLISFFNFKVDSSGVFGNSNYLSRAAKAITSGKMIAGLQNIDDRLFQDLIIKNLQVRNEIIAIGSSTTMQLRKEIVTNETNNFFNHSVNGASLEDYIAIIGAYESIHGYLPSTVILGVDPWVFNKNSGQGRWVGLKKYYDYALDKINGEEFDSKSNSNVKAIKLKQLINFDYTVSNIKFFIRTLLKSDDNNPSVPLKAPKRVKAPTKIELEKLSDSELILKAIDSGIAEKIEFGGSQALDPSVPSYEKELANRDELIEALLEFVDLLTVPPIIVNDLKFNIVDTIETDDFIRVDDGSIYYPYKIRYKTSDLVKLDAVAFAKYNPYSLGKYDELTNLKFFEDFVGYLQLNKVNVILFLPPYNPISYDLLVESKKYNIILDVEKFLKNFAKLNNIEIKGSYNPHNYGLAYEDFFDGVHGRDLVLKKIFQRTL